MNAFPLPQSPLRLRLALGALMLVLLVPAGVLVREAWRQVRWEGLHQQQVLARELVAGINRSLERIRSDEAAIAFDEYAFATLPSGAANVVQRSALSEFPVRAGLPGLLGRFQVGADGAFTTPLLPTANPEAFGIPEAEYRDRAAREGEVYAVLQAEPVPVERPSDVPAAGERADAGVAEAIAFADQHSPASEATLDRRLAEAPAPSPMTSSRPPDAADQDAGNVPAKRQDAAADEIGAASAEPAEEAVGERRSQAIFDRLASNAAVADSQPSSPPARQRASRDDGAGTAMRERAERGPAAAAPLGQLAKVEQEADEQAPAERLTDARLLSIDAALDSLSFLLLDSDHFVIFRRQFRDGRRYLQGAALGRADFVARLIGDPFRDSAVSGAADLTVAWGEAPLETIPGRSASRRLSYDADGGALAGELLHEERLIAPFDGLRLRFLARDIPPGPGGPVVLWTGGALLLLTLAGFHLLYRAGVRQLELSRQQQDFVSAVSHELRTPLTSIRMYSEMLKAGWADESRKREYYDYIHDESERLSRLVANVLQLSRMNRTGLELDRRPEAVGDLLEAARPSLAQVAAAGEFELELTCPPELAAATISVDRDAFHQVLLNLVENAVKFAGGAERKVVRITVGAPRTGRVEIAVRDFGPGLPAGDPARLFELFYRPPRASENAPGTGIGLALVRGLAEAMGGQVRAERCDPGARFVLAFQCADDGAPTGAIAHAT